MLQNFFSGAVTGKDACMSMDDFFAGTGIDWHSSKDKEKDKGKANQDKDKANQDKDKKKDAKV
jgi:hypothetical protein